MLFDQSAHIYDAVYAARGKDYAAETARILDLARDAHVPAGSRLLDVACGTGEHLLHLKGHFDVTGADRSEAMLEVARRKLPDTPLYRQSMTVIDLPKKFRIITCLFSSIGYLSSIEEVRSAIRAMANHLEPAGLLLIEPAVTREQLRPPRPFTMTARSNGIEITRHETAEITSNALVIRFDYELRRANGAESFSEEHAMLLLERDAYITLARDAGLNVRWDDHGLCGRGMMICRQLA